MLRLPDDAASGACEHGKPGHLRVGQQNILQTLLRRLRLAGTAVPAALTCGRFCSGDQPLDSAS